MTNEPRHSESTATLPPPPVGPPLPGPTQAGRPRHSIWPALVIAALAIPAMVVTFVAFIVIVVVSGIASGEIVVTEKVEVSLAPEELSDLPASIVEESADVEIDLTNIDIAALRGDVPFDLDVEVEFGTVEVIGPQGLPVSVDASTDLGDVTVFDESEDGFDNRVVQQADDAAITLDLDVNVGEVDVVRG